MSRNPPDGDDSPADRAGGAESAPGAESGLAARLGTDAVLDVAEFNAALGDHVEAHPLTFDYVVGDVSDCYEARSGHTYFDLTGEDAAIDCALWAHATDRVTAAPEDGLRAAVSGAVSFYEPQGAVTLVVEDLVPVGESEYGRERAAARERLASAGLLDPDRKQPLPEAPRRVGLVTSAGSDARADAVRSIRERHPGVDIVVQDAAVQGADALPSLLGALEALDDDPAVDLLVVTRGGGADATLRLFDDPALCRAIAETTTPVVVGVGHEQDRPLADEVADRRVMTPTHVGEVIPDREARLAEVATLRDRLEGAHERAAAARLTERRDRLDGAYTDLATDTLSAHADALDAARERLVRDRLADRAERLDLAYERTVAGRLSALGADLDAALARREREIEFAAEKADLADEATATIRRQRLLIGALALLVAALAAYIIITP